MGQGARFVKYDRVRPGNRFQILAALYRDAAVSGLPHGGKDRQRHGQLQRAGEVHHQHGQGAVDIPGQQPGGGAARQGVGHQLVRQVCRPVLRQGLQLFRLLDHGDDLIVSAAAGLLLHTEDAFALLHHRTGVYGGAGALGDGDGFTGQGRLVDHDLALQNHAVQGDHPCGR